MLDLTTAGESHGPGLTCIVQGMPAPLPGGVVTGSVRRDEGELRISALHVVLDTTDSDVFAKVRG